MSTRLYVANLPAGTTDDDLSELFGTFGAVASAAVVIDKNTGRSRGFALIEMEDGADAAVDGAMLAIRKVGTLRGLHRGLDKVMDW